MYLLTHTCSISRNKAVGTNGRRTMAVIATGVPASFQPMNTRTTIQNGLSIGRAYDAYFGEGTDVRAGDKLTWNGNTHIVSAVQNYANMPPVSHVRALCEQEIS